MAISALSSLWGSRAAADAMEAQARIARVQGQIALQTSKFSARMQLKAGRQEATFRRRESRRASGAAVVSVAGAGIELSGSPMKVIGARIHGDAVNAARVVTNAQVRAFSERAEGKAKGLGFRADAAALDERARITRVTGWLNAIGGGMSAVGGYYAMTSNPNSNPWSLDGRYGY